MRVRTKHPHNSPSLPTTGFLGPSPVYDSQMGVQGQQGPIAGQIRDEWEMVPNYGCAPLRDYILDKPIKIVSGSACTCLLWRNENYKECVVMGNSPNLIKDQIKAINADFRESEVNREELDYYKPLVQRGSYRLKEGWFRTEQEQRDFIAYGKSLKLARRPGRELIIVSALRSLWGYITRSRDERRGSKTA